MNDKNDGSEFPRMTNRQRVAIKLRVPDSGTPWLDKMILEAQRNELQAMFASLIVSGNVIGGPVGFAERSLVMADAMLAERAKKGATND